MAGALLIADAALTVLWQEPVSALYARLQQGKLDDQLAQLEHEPTPPVERKALLRLPPGERRLAFAARSLDRRPHAGQGGRAASASPRSALSSVVVDGTDAGDLRKGRATTPPRRCPAPGHRRDRRAPHDVRRPVPPHRPRSSRRPDDRRDALRAFAYRVERTRIVPPTPPGSSQRRRYDRLVLTACHPLYSAAKRIVVFARLVRATPKGTAA